MKIFIPCGVAVASKRKPHWAFTLIELLVVIAIIGILAAMTMPALAAAKRKATMAGCQSNYHQEHLALTMWLGDHNDFLPPENENPNTGRGLWGWQAPAYSASSVSAEGELMYYLSSYLGYPFPSSTVTNLAKVMICPGFAATVSSADLSNVSMYNLDGHTSDDLLAAGVINGSIGFMPFGSAMATPSYGLPASSGVTAHKIDDVGAAAALSSVWYICDMDCVGTPTGAGVAGVTIPATPAHGSVRNYVYFDGHVSAHKVKDNSPWPSYLYKQ